MADQYEFFGTERCDATLPINTVVEEHTFGQFVTLAITVRGEQRPINIVEPPNSESSIHESLRFMMHGVPLEAVVNNTFDTPMELRTVTVNDDELNRLLAEGQLKVDGQSAPVELSSTAISALLRRQPVTVTANTVNGPLLLRVMTPVAKAKAPAVTRHEIQDFGAFVVAPQVPGVDDLPFDIALSPKVVGELRKTGHTHVKAGPHALELVLSPSPKIDSGDKAVTNTYLNAATQDEALAKQSIKEPNTLTPGTRPWTGPHVALFLPWKQRWELLGYSRGTLLHSLSLAPQEETTIEIFTWDRKKRALEQESQTETEQLFERTDIQKDTADVINELTNSGEFQAQADARVRVTYPAVQAEVGGQLSDKQTFTKIAKRTAQHLTESTNKAATRVKTRRSTKITETMEMGREERVTRKVRNPNMCHTLNLDYFEVVANYRVVTQFADEDAAICVLVDMPSAITNIRLDDPRNCRIHEKALAGALLYRGLASGFDAARLLASRAYAKALVCDKVRCVIPLKTTPTGGGTTIPQPQMPEIPETVINAFNDVKQAAASLIQAQRSPLLNLWRDNATAEPPPEYISGFRRWLYWTLLNRLIRRLSDVLTATQRDGDVRSLMQNIFSAVPGAGAVMQPNTLLDEQQVKRDFDNIVWLALDGYHHATRWAVWWWDTLRGHGALYPDDNGLIVAIQTFQTAYGSWQRNQQQQAAGPGEEQLLREQQQQQIDMDNDRLEYAYPLREVADAQERMDALLAHLMHHQSYYHYAILQAMPLGDQMQLLAAANAPLELCEPRVIGMIQGTNGAPDRIAVPLNLALLAPRDGTSKSRQAMQELKRFVDEILDDLRASEGGRRDINLPTSGVMLEARLGHCDACEDFIAQSRTVDLELRREQVRALRATTALQEAEARRYEARLTADPPQLADPKTTADGVRIQLDPLQVTLEQQPRSNS